jgi:hypothetical protein
VIVIVGSPVGRIVDGRLDVAGLTGRAAVAAAQAEASVQVVGRIGNDPDADRLLLALAAAGVGHVAVLRDPARATPVEVEGASRVTAGTSEAIDIEIDTEDEGATSQPAAISPIALDAADVELGLRYLTDFRVVVLFPPAQPDVVTIVADAARWASARLVLIVDETAGPASLPPDAIVLQAPDTDPDGVFAELVGRLAAALDAGADPTTALRDIVRDEGWAPSATDA